MPRTQGKKIGNMPLTRRISERFFFRVMVTAGGVFHILMTTSGIFDGWQKGLAEFFRIFIEGCKRPQEQGMQ
jgi:hypothetical protein